MKKNLLCLFSLFIGIYILFLFSCPPIPPADPEPTVIPTAAPTPIPTGTPVSTPIPTGTPISTPIPTATPGLTPTPTPAPTMTPTPTTTPAPTDCYKCIQFQTPCEGNIIYAKINEELSPQEMAQTWDSINQILNNPELREEWGLIEVIELTGTYNCHGYAWTYNFNMPKCQLDEPELWKFTADNSFIQIQESEVQDYLNRGYKVVVKYNGVDHSAIIEGTDLCVWTAKMGPKGALVRHYQGAKYDVYYDRAIANGGFTYYVVNYRCLFTAAETLTVPADGSKVYSSNLYSSAHEYKIEVSGTFKWGGCDPVTCPDGGGCNYDRYGDAEWLTDDCRFNTVFADFYTWDISLFFNGNNVDWGSFSPAHIYSIITRGNDSLFSFRIEDCPGCYGDNAGGLTVTIFAPGN